MKRNTPALRIPIVVEAPGSGELARAQAAGQAAGSVIGEKYRVDRLLAVGGMGVVYACTDTLLDRRVAVKVIHPDIAEDESIRARFLLEARTLARLTNPHVTRVFECGYTGAGQPYMVMELLGGTDLYRVLKKRGRLTAERTARFALQVCRGLRDAHALGIVHRDLKPENLFVTHGSNGVELIKILDFGISKQSRLYDQRSLTNPSMNIGSPHYMPPEQVRSPSTVDGRADIWALGVVMYEALVGHPPFEGSTLAELCRAVMSEPVPPLPASVDREMARIVKRCLERDLSKRYPDVLELASDLRALLERRSGSLPRASESSADGTTPATARPLSRRPSRGRSWLLRVSLCAGAAGVTFGSLRAGLLKLPETAPHTLLEPIWPSQTPSAPAPVPSVETRPFRIPEVTIYAGPPPPAKDPEVEAAPAAKPLQDVTKARAKASQVEPSPGGAARGAVSYERPELRGADNPVAREEIPGLAE